MSLIKLSKLTKDMIFRMNAWHFGLIISLILIFLLWGMFRLLTMLLTPAFLRYTILLVFPFLYAFSRMSLFNRVGVGFAQFLLFGVLFTFGLRWAYVIVFVSTLITFIMCIYPTPIDLIIGKNFDKQLRQVIGHAFWLAIAGGFFSYMGTEWILADPGFAYRIGLVLWVANTFIWQKILTVEPLPSMIIKSTMTAAFQMILSITIVTPYIYYLVKYASV